MWHRQSQLVFYLAAYGLSCVVVWAIAFFWMPLPPKNIVFGVDAGTTETSSYRTAMRYRAALEAVGIRVEFEQLPRGQQVLSWISGSRKDNLVGFAPSSLSVRHANDAVLALATIGTQPIWIATTDTTITQLSDLRGKRIAVDQLGGPTHEVARMLLAQARIKPQEVTWVGADALDAVAKLFRDEVDALVAMDVPDAPLIRMLFAEQGISIVNHPYAGVIAQREPYMQTVVMPQGAIELRGNVPPQDLILLASGHELVVSSRMHPALQRVLLDVAVSEHSVASFMQREAQYPEFRTTLPLSPTARDYANGHRPWMQHAFPYWWADLVRLMLWVVLPVLLLTTLLLIWLPRLAGWKTDNLLMHYYGELYFLEDDLFHAKAKGLVIQRELLTRLDRLEREVRLLNLPEEFIDRWYGLRTDLAATRLRILEIDSAYSAHLTH